MNPTTQIAKVESSSHWYIATDKVEPFHSVPYAGKRGKNGETRSTTLRDARKVNALPSVTNVLSILHKEFLVAYKVNQAILACLTLPKIEGETADAFAHRVFADSKEHAASAARLGTRLHEVGAEFLLGKAQGGIQKGERIESRDLHEVSLPLRHLIADIIPAGMFTAPEFSEFCIANQEIGYGGACDGFVFLDTKKAFVAEKLESAGYGHLVTGKPLVAMVDIKSRGADSKTPPIYETDTLQLSAYLHAVPTTPKLGFQMDPNNTPVANILINTHHDAGHDGRWSSDLVIHHRDDIAKAWTAFKHAHALWCWVKNYNPSAA